MKLAEALIVRADQQRRLEQLRARLIRNAKAQEGESPGEDPAQLLTEFNRIADGQTQLIQNINRTDASTDLDAGTTIADAIATRDALRSKHVMYRDLAEAATIKQDRSTISEVKFKSTVRVADIQTAADDFARQHRDLDSRIQAINWEADLVEQG